MIMEVKENVFLSTNGILTSTEGNFLCNISQELIKEAQERLNSVKFYKVSVASIAGGEKQLMTVGNTSIDFIREDLDKISQMNSFCAWVREAIKSKEEWTKRISNTSFNNWADDKGIELPDCPRQVYKETTPTEQDVINSWNTDKRNKYLKFEAFASTYGKYIHPKGAFAEARKDAHTAVNCPIYKEGSGRDLVLYYQEPTIAPDKIDAEFMELQSIYRSYEKELNAMKASLKDELNALILESNRKHQDNLSKYQADYAQYIADYEKIRHEFENWKTIEIERVSKLKIIIPDTLMNIYSELKEKSSSK